jgi:hypothetical protein
MAMPMTADQMVAQMKKWNVPYKEYAGWRTRRRPGAFTDIRGVIIHHTGSDAGQSDGYLDFLFKTGRPESGIPGPLCHVATDMDGDLHLGAIGRANHAGKGSSSTLAKVTTENYPGYAAEIRAGSDNTDGNAHFYGNEVRYDGGQPMTAKQYDAAVRWAAAICDFYGWSALSVIGHREWTTRKPDPGNCPMNKFRADVAALLKSGPSSKADSTAPEDPTVSDTYYAHVHAKACAVTLEGVFPKIGMTPPTRPTETGTGDAYFAHYWAKHAANLAVLIDTKLTNA